MGDPTGGAGCYVDLHKSDRSWLRKTAAQLRAHLGASARGLVAAGEALKKARRRLGRDRWRPWLAKEAQIAPRTAYKYMRVSNAFAGVDSDALQRFTVGALYELSDPAFPGGLRAFCIEQAGDGVAVTLETVGEWRAAYYKPVTDAKLSLASKDEKPPEPECGAPFAEENWQLVNDLLGPDSTLLLSHIVDVENGEPLVSAARITAAGVRKQSAAPTLEVALLELAGVERKKQCRGKCKLVLHLDEFSNLKGSRDGRNKYCKKCERTRVGDYLRAKSAGSKKAG